jgi:hypothetical protein
MKLSPGDVELVEIVDIELVEIVELCGINHIFF